MTDAAVADRRPDRGREILVYLLAIVTVAGIGWAYLHKKASSDDLYRRWAGEPLTIQEIADRLSSDDADAITHALVQLEIAAQSKDPVAKEKIAPLAAKFDRLSKHEKLEVRMFLVHAAQSIDADPSRATLQSMLADPADEVRLNAALGLSKWNDDAGADIIAAALERLRPDQIDMRRQLLLGMSFVAGPRHRDLFLRMEEIATLDRDERSSAICRAVLDRIGRSAK